MRQSRQVFVLTLPPGVSRALRPGEGELAFRITTGDAMTGSMPFYTPQVFEPGISVGLAPNGTRLNRRWVSGKAAEPPVLHGKTWRDDTGD